MRFMFFPVVRLADHLSRHGFRVSRSSRSEQEEDDEFFVSHRDRVLATVTRRFGRAVTVTYGKPDPQLISIARRYGDVLADGGLSPERPVGAEDVTGKAVAQTRRDIAVILAVLCLLYLAMWWFGWRGDISAGG